MNINRLLILSLVLSLALHLALFLWNGFPGLRSSGSPSPEKKSILLTFRLSGPSTPGPSRKSPVKRESFKKPRKKTIPKPIPKSPPSKPKPSKSRPQKPRPRRPRPQKPASKKVSPSPPDINSVNNPRKTPKPPEASKSPPTPSPGGEAGGNTALRTAKTTPRPPGPSFSGPSGQNRRNSYLSLILAQIRKKRYYPLLARRRGYQGRVGLWLTISPEGQLLSVKIFQGSGHRILDRAALKIVQRAAPFPPPPPELGPWPLKIKIFLKFYLTK